jgi:hypothetical protein
MKAVSVYAQHTALKVALKSFYTTQTVTNFVILKIVSMIMVTAKLLQSAVTANIWTGLYAPLVSVNVTLALLQRIVFPVNL